MALREINMIPEAVLLHRYLRRHAILWALSYGLVLAILLSGYLVYMQGISSATRRPESEKDVRRRIALTIGEIETKQEEVERLAFVREATTIHGAAPTLDHLAELLDPKTWLTSLSIESDRENGYRLMMQGRAISNARLGASMRALTADAHIADVALQSSSEIRTGSRGAGAPSSLIQFSIEARTVTE